MVSRQKDGAWSWVIAVAVLLSQTLLGGICLSAGMFFVIFQNALNTSTITTSWLCSLPITTWFCATPIGSILTNKFGYRTCSLIGGIVAATGLSLCYFAKNVGFLFLSFGILTGFGFGVNYTGCMTAVNVYCDKYKTIATGLVSIGHNLSLIIYSKFIIFLDDRYGWRGSMLIHGAITFNLCLFAALMSPLDADLQDRHSDTDQKVASNSHKTLTGTGSDIENGSLTYESSSYNRTKNTNYNANLEYVSKTNTRSDNSLRIKASDTSVTREQLKPLTGSDDELEIKTEYKQIETKRSSSKLGLFKNPDFCCLCASNILCNISQGIYILHLPPYASKEGFTRDDFGLVLTVYGATNIVGKIFYSFLGQHPKFNVISLYAVSLTASGVCMCLTPAFLSRTGMLSLAGLNGFFYCVTGALMLAVVFQIVGYEQFANGIGLSLPFKATGNLIGGPLGGTLFYITGDYRVSFIVAGVTLIMASALIIVPVLKDLRCRRPVPNQTHRNINKFSVCETEVHEDENF